VMQQQQIDEQLLDLAHKDQQLQNMRDEVDTREASISKLCKKLVKYKLHLDTTKVATWLVGGGCGCKVGPKQDQWYQVPVHL